MPVRMSQCVLLALVTFLALQAVADPVVPPDNSLTIEEYQHLGVPDPQQPPVHLDQLFAPEGHMASRFRT